MKILSKIKFFKQRGFMLLLSILISAIIMAIGIGISNFVLKELILASTARNSLYGYYSADAGVECAMYWNDINGRRDDNRFGLMESTIYCDGKELTIKLDGDLDKCSGLLMLTDPHHFEFSLGPAGEENDQYVITNVCVSPTRTRVVGDGSNNNRTLDVKRVERSIQSEYDTI